MRNILITASVLFSLIVPAPVFPDDKAAEAPAPEREAGIEERWGIRIIALRLSAGGNMLDFRYRLTDPEKARPLFDRRIKPYLIDDMSGARLLVPNAPKLGAMRQTPRNPVAGKDYFVLFANPGIVKAGSKVTVVIGDFRAENLTVE